MRNIWQIGSGEADRNYSKLFEDFDVMCIGPGDFGDIESNIAKYDESVKAGLLTKNKRDQLIRFKSNLKSGDIMLLREGYRVVQIGVIPSDENDSKYFWDSTFDDVYGWDLQHTRRVIWQAELKNELDRIQETNGLFHSRKQIPAFTAVQDPTVLDPIRRLFDKIKFRKLKSPPGNMPEELNLEEIGIGLFEAGLPNDAVDKVISLIERHRRLVNWYNKYTDKFRPTEHEVVAYLIVPLLLALGWSEQLIAIEWLKIDLAAFESTPTSEDNCILLCEAKGKGHGLQNTLEQAKAYVKDKNLVKAKKIILTDGIRIYMYERNSREDWSNEPAGYINIMKIRTNHLIPQNTNAIETLISLTPAGISRNLSK